MLKRTPLFFWVAAAAVVLAAGAIWAGQTLLGRLGEMPLAAKVGGPFKLTDHNGRRFSSQQLAGKPYAVFFGFTLCPDVCPTTLLELTTDIEALGADADKMRYVFISVDPERDTPEHLKTYLSNFNPRIIGLTGTPAEIAAVAKAYRVFYEKVPTKEGYTVNHTATTYLMDAKGRFVSTMAYREATETRRAKLHKLIAGAG